MLGPFGGGLTGGLDGDVGWVSGAIGGRLDDGGGGGSIGL